MEELNEKSLMNCEEGSCPMIASLGESIFYQFFPIRSFPNRGCIYCFNDNTCHFEHCKTDHDIQNPVPNEYIEHGAVSCEACKKSDADTYWVFENDGNETTICYRCYKADTTLHGHTPSRRVVVFKTALNQREIEIPLVKYGWFRPESTYFPEISFLDVAMIERIRRLKGFLSEARRMADVIDELSFYAEKYFKDDVFKDDVEVFGTVTNIIEFIIEKTRAKTRFSDFIKG